VGTVADIERMVAEHYVANGMKKDGAPGQLAPRRSMHGSEFGVIMWVASLGAQPFLPCMHAAGPWMPPD
jgi:hypothetical protein